MSEVLLNWYLLDEQTPAEEYAKALFSEALRPFPHAWFYEAKFSWSVWFGYTFGPQTFFVRSFKLCCCSHCSAHTLQGLYAFGQFRLDPICEGTYPAERKDRLKPRDELSLHILCMYACLSCPLSNVYFLEHELKQKHKGQRCQTIRIPNCASLCQASWSMFCKE